MFQFFGWYEFFFLFDIIQDPYYDSETYRGDGGDGTGNWIYEKVFSFYIYVTLLILLQ